MSLIPPVLRTKFIEACHEVGARELSFCSSGNLSMRLDDELLLISASRSWLSRITEGELSVCRIEDGKLVEGNRPSVETSMHRGIYRVRPDANVVLHFQSPSATALCCTNREIDFNIIPEVPYYIGPIGRVPYITPGSPELAAAVTERMKRHDLSTLANHGLILCSTDLAHAIQNAAFFELACDILLRTGENARLLDPDAVEALRAAGPQSSRRI